MWELLYETFWDKLEHFCFKLCRDETRAEDLTQEAFLRALQNRTLIDSFTERQCKAWLFATARNLYCDQVRRTAKEEQLLQTFFPAEERADDDAELGQLLCLPPGTVRSRLAQIRRHLKTELSEE